MEIGLLLPVELMRHGAADAGRPGATAAAADAAVRYGGGGHATAEERPAAAGREIGLQREAEERRDGIGAVGDGVIGAAGVEKSRDPEPKPLRHISNAAFLG